METRMSDLFINLENERQVKWWNRIGSFLAKAEYNMELIEDGTKKPIGYFIWLKKRYIQ